MKKNQKLNYLLTLFKTNKSAVIFSCFIFILLSILNLIASYSIKYLVDIGILQKQISVLIILSFVLFFSQVSTIFLGTIGLKLSEKSANRILYLEKEKIINIIYTQSDVDSVDIHPTEFRMLLTSYIDNLKFFFADLPRVLSEVLFLIMSSITVLVFIDNVFVIVIIFSLILNIILYIIFSKILEKQSKEELEINRKSNIWLFNVIHNSKEYIVNCGLMNVMKKIKYNYSLIQNIGLKKNAIILTSSFLSDLITELVILSMYIYLNNRVSLGDVLVAISFTKIIFPMLKTLLEMFRYYKMLSPSIELVLNIKNKYNGVKKRYISRTKDDSSNYFISDLNFSYGEKQIFNNTNISFNKKGIIIFNSPNGTGKTTLVKILFNLLSVESGKTNILVEDIEYLSQLSVLFPGDIFFNITFKNRSQLTEEDFMLIKKSLQLSGANDIIESKKDVIITMDEDVLSGGEKRLINLTRFFYLAEKKKILILDEPDTGLDYEKKNRLKEQLNHLSKDKLIILITHDEIFNDLGNKYCIEGGEIIEC